MHVDKNKIKNRKLYKTKKHKKDILTKKGTVKETKFEISKKIW